MKQLLCLLVPLCLLFAVGCQPPADMENDKTAASTTTTTANHNPDPGNEMDNNSVPSDLPAKMYALETDDPMLRATIQLAAYNNRFSITLPQQQELQPYGTYRLSDGKLTLAADDSGGAVYVFRLTDEDTLVFLADESTPFPAINVITDGAVFA